MNLYFLLLSSISSIYLVFFGSQHRLLTFEYQFDLIEFAIKHQLVNSLFSLNN